jgi:hypothetical protein
MQYIVLYIALYCTAALDLLSHQTGTAIWNVSMEIENFSMWERSKEGA